MFHFALKPKPTHKWLLLIHQLPAKPTNLRVRTWRKLQLLGAVSIKNSVYVLPFNEKTNEDFQWLKQEIDAAGGEASLFHADSVEGTTDEELVAAFCHQRDEDYAKLISEFEDFAASLGERRISDSVSVAKLGQYEMELDKLRRELESILSVDFFNASKRKRAQETFEKCLRALQRLRSSSAKAAPDEGGSARLDPAQYQNRRWVTRKDPHIDRLACGWLIKRFIDKRPRFGFVDEGTSTEGSISFDMVGADFTHRGDDCSFETFIKSFGLDGDVALGQIAEIVHDVDLKDGKFNRLEANGVNAVIRGLAEVYGDDNERLKRSFPLFDGLYELFGSSDPSKDGTGLGTGRANGKNENDGQRSDRDDNN
ncbi:MAG: chromate resistance protein [Acidobacteria bacterium]|nr:chromate resistance protein [Acidobacteriota bacterium]